MIPSSDWRKKLDYPRDLVEWAASRPEATFYDLWEEIIDPTWLPCLAYVGGATQKQLVFAACAVSRLCLHMAPEGENRPRIAIETAEAWTRGEATAKQVEMARRNADAAYPYSSPSDITYAHITSVCTALSVSSTTAAFASTTSFYTLRAGIESQLICATIRKHLPFERPPKLKRLTIWQRLAEGDE